MINEPRPGATPYGGSEQDIMAGLTPSAQTRTPDRLVVTVQSPQVPFPGSLPNPSLKQGLFNDLQSPVPFSAGILRYMDE